jgi:hypothetical protein
VLFIGDDWAEDHHDIEFEDEAGRRLIRARLPEGLDGITRLHALVAEHAPAAWASLSPEQAAGQVVVGIETDRGPWVTALRAAGYQVYAINTMSVARYRDRHSTSGAKSDAGDAHVLAEIVRLDRDHHRPIAGDSDLADVINLLARAHLAIELAPLRVNAVSPVVIETPFWDATPRQRRPECSPRSPNAPSADGWAHPTSSRTRSGFSSKPAS